MARKSRTQPKQSTDTLKALSKVYKTAIRRLRNATARINTAFFVTKLK